VKLVSTRLKPTVWLLATSSLMLPNAVDCDVRPLTDVLIAPNRDMFKRSENIADVRSRNRAKYEVTDFADIVL